MLSQRAKKGMLKCRLKVQKTNGNSIVRSGALGMHISDYVFDIGFLPFGTTFELLCSGFSEGKAFWLRC